MNMMGRKFNLLALLLCVVVFFSSCGQAQENEKQEIANETKVVETVKETSKEEIKNDSYEEKTPEPSNEIINITNEAYRVLNGNKPQFKEDEVTTTAFEKYSSLDKLGRCGVAFACLGEEIMPTEERGAIGQIKPSGWHLTKYDIVDGKYLYNRCHLIGYQLSGENANEKNLITGTRYLNMDGMLPFENKVADYIKETKNHVMYRVTPVFEGDNLLANGVKIEALSVEDDGKGISFNVFVNNIQPGVEINYKDGTSKLTGTEVNEEAKVKEAEPKSVEVKTGDYVLNTNTHKFHYPSCSSAKTIKDKNRESYNGTREWLINNNYSPCKKCNP